ncbi:HTH_Tnp_Tc3_2 domain-containing protein [Trichonephila clavipes]|nr:HTH_Tnp_Tc3_2 domain-containing protein [Trichonephila clavipes]
MPRVRSRKTYQHVSDFEKGRIVAYRDCGLSSRSIAPRVDRDLMTVSRIWNRWVQDSNTERRTESQRLPTTRAEKTGMSRIALMDRTVTSRIGVIC